MSRIWIRTAAALALCAAAATAAASDFPPQVAQALAGQDCDSLVALNKHYWSLPADAERERITAALESAILALPRCGTLSAALVRAEPVRGPNPFDPRRPLGSDGQRR